MTSLCERPQGGLKGRTLLQTVSLHFRFERRCSEGRPCTEEYTSKEDISLTKLWSGKNSSRTITRKVQTQRQLGGRTDPGLGPGGCTNKKRMIKRIQLGEKFVHLCKFCLWCRCIKCDSPYLELLVELRLFYYNSLGLISRRDRLL